MDERLVRSVVKTFRDRLQAELISIRDQPADEWSPEAVEAARRVIQERQQQGVEESEDMRISAQRSQEEAERLRWMAEEAGRKETLAAASGGMRTQIDGLATAVATLGAAGLITTSYLTLSHTSDLTFGVIVSIAVLTVGVGLQRRWHGARISTLGCAFLLLPAFPIGTVIGVYLWRLLRDHTQYEVSSRTWRDHDPYQ